MAAEKDRDEVTAEDLEAAAWAEAYNPWSVVHAVFDHLCDQGLHPTLGRCGDPGVPAGELLRCLGIEPRAEGDPRVQRDIREHLAEIRSAMLGDP